MDLDHRQKQKVKFSPYSDINSILNPTGLNKDYAPNNMFKDYDFENIMEHCNCQYISMEAFSTISSVTEHQIYARNKSAREGCRFLSIKSC